MTLSIPLTQGQFAIIDDEYAELAEYRWCAIRDSHTGNYYAVRTARDKVQGKTIGLHRAVMERKLNRPLLSSERIDHINRNGLDNTAGNLRLATPSENSCNRGKQRNNKSGYKGVSWATEKRRWVAQIKVDGKVRHLGYFLTPEAAYEVYCKAAKEHFGEFARLD